MSSPIDAVASRTWPYPAPFILPWDITDAQLDHYRHVNNAAYVSQMEATARAHSLQLGIGLDDLFALDCAMVIAEHHIRYLSPAHLGERLQCATWITYCDGRLRLRRAFAFIEQASGRKVLSADTHYVCVAQASGKPKAMPDQLARTYGDNQCHRG